MRPITSCRVKMPAGLPSASTIGSEPMRRSSISASASLSGIEGGTVTGALRSSAASGVERPRCSVTVAAYSAWKDWRERSSRCCSRRVQKSLNTSERSSSRSNTSAGNARMNVSASAAYSVVAPRRATSAPSGSMSPATELPLRGAGPGNHHALAAHAALADEEAVARPAVAGRQDRLAGRVVAHDRRSHDFVDVRLGHLRERRVPLHHLTQAGKDGGRGCGHDGTGAFRSCG